MVDKKAIQLKDFFLYFSLTIVIILLLYTYASKYAEKNLYKPPQGNALNVSPLTGEEINSVLKGYEAYMVSYSKGVSIKDLSGELQGDIIFELYDKEKNELTYKGLYYNTSPLTIPGIEKINTIAIDNLPPFSFRDSSEGLPIYYKGAGELVYIEYSKTASTTFMYQNGYYKYSSSLQNDDTPVVSNLIIQLIDEDYSKTKGNAIIISGGKACSGTWESVNNTTIIKDYTGAPMTLMEGKSWWMTVVEGSSILIE